MNQSSKVNSCFGPLITLVMLFVFCYFAYHSISGSRGLLALIDLNKQVNEAKSELDVVSSDRLKLENKVKLLWEEALDLDMLDEQARRLLGYVAEDETVYVSK